jgi:hypothetical protein
MAAKDSIGKASAAAQAAQSNQYVQRILEDDELRGNLLAAFTAARSAYGRVSNGKPVKELFEDRKLQQHLAEAAGALRDATGALQEEAQSKSKSKRRRGGGVGRKLLIVLVGGALAVALSEGLRSKVLDLLFGAEEEFDYSSTTAPEQPAPAGVAGS